MALVKLNRGDGGFFSSSLPLSFLSFPYHPALPKPTAEILCCSAKALHLLVITNHPSLGRLPGVEPPCALCNPFPHPTPSPLLQTCGHCGNYVKCTLSLTLGVGAEALREHYSCCDDHPTASRCPLSGPVWRQIGPHNATFTHALTLPCLQERTGRPCLNRMHLVCLPAQGQGQPATWLLCQAELTYGWACHCYNKGTVVALWVQEKGSHPLGVFTTQFPYQE